MTTRTRRARPKPGDPDYRGEKIDVRTSRDERAELEAAAGDQPVSTWLRDVGLAEARRRRGEAAPAVVPLDEARAVLARASEELDGLARR